MKSNGIFSRIKDPDVIKYASMVTIGLALVAVFYNIMNGLIYPLVYSSFSNNDMKKIFWKDIESKITNPFTGKKVIVKYGPIISSIFNLLIVVIIIYLLGFII